MLLFLVACASAPAPTANAPQASASPFNVLVVAGVSGPTSGVSLPCVNGLQASALVINREGGILGHKVQITTKDDQGNATQGVSLLTQALGTGTTWNFAYAGATSDEALAQMPTINGAKVINMASAAARQLGDPSLAPYHFTTGVDTDFAVKILIENVVKLNPKKIGVFTSDAAFGQQENAAMQKDLKAAGANFVSASFPASSIDLTPQLLQLQSQGVDLVVWSGLGVNIGYVAKSRAKIGWNIPFIGDLGVSSGDVFTLAGGPDNINNMSYLTYAINVYKDPTQQSSAFKSFFEALHAVAVTISTPLNLYAACYDELRVMKLAAVATNSLDSDKLKSYLESGFKPPKDTLLQEPQGWGWTKSSHLPVSSADEFVLTKAGQLVEGQIRAS